MQTFNLVHKLKFHGTKDEIVNIIISSSVLLFPNE